MFRKFVDGGNAIVRNELISRRARNLFSARRLLVCTGFFWAALLAVVGLAACDNNSGDAGGSGSNMPTSTAASGVGSTVLPRSGEAVFTRYCAVCHPGGGRGSGPSLITRDIAAAEIRAKVRNGAGRMPPFGPTVISDDDLGALVDYVRGIRH